jgi:hypothetical protein
MKDTQQGAPAWHSVVDVLEVVAEAAAVSELLAMRAVCSRWLAAVRHRVALPSDGVICPSALPSFKLGAPFSLRRHYATVLTVLLSPVAVDAYTPNVTVLKRHTLPLLAEWLHERHELWATRLGGIRAIDLTGCCTAPPKHYDFGRRLANLTSLTLHGCERVNGRAIDLLTSCDPASAAMAHLDLSGCTELDDGTSSEWPATVARAWPNLEFVDVSHTKLCAGAIGPLANLERLRVLKIANTAAPAVHIVLALCAGAARHTIREVVATRSAPGNDAEIRAMLDAEPSPPPPLAVLETLRIEHCKLESHNARFLRPQRLPALVYLDTVGNDQLNVARMKELTRELPRLVTWRSEHAHPPHAAST